jgi:hypothetical protein
MPYRGVVVAKADIAEQHRIRWRHLNRREPIRSATKFASPARPRHQFIPAHVQFLSQTSRLGAAIRVGRKEPAVTVLVISLAF